MPPAKTRGREIMRKQLIGLLTIIGLVMLTAAGVSAMGTKPPKIFDNYVSIGDSITHGFQSGAVDETRQPTAYPALLANKMGTPFNLPLLKFPGYLVNIEDVLKGNIAWWQYYYPLVGGERVDNYSGQSTLNNFGITGAAAHDGLNTYGSAGGFYKLVLGPSGAPSVKQALARKPTFVSFWLANNDVLGSALQCDTGALTPLAQFRNDFLACVNQIAAKETSKGGTIQGVVLLNVPDVTCIAYLKEVNDPGLPAGSRNPFWMPRASANMVLTPADLALIQQRTAEINQEIYYAALANNWAHVDANGVFMDINNYGHALKDGNGLATSRTITTDYLGGLFSLDGVHPSVTGHAVAANHIIDEVNMKYGQNLAPVNEVAVAAGDTLLTRPVDPRNYLDGWVADAIYFVVELFM